MSLLHRLLPHQCHLCAAPANDYLCQGCAADLPLLGHHCPRCALPLEHARSECGDCLRYPKPFSQTYCAFEYKPPLSTLIYRFKNGQACHLAHYLCQPLIDQLPPPNNENRLFDALVPVPSHWSSRFRRGYNPARVLTDILSSTLKIPVLDILKKPRRHTSQKKLNRKERLKNLDATLTVQGTAQGLTVAVVDDVMTTGATAITASECLLSAGATNVMILTLARTPKKGM